MTSSNPKIVAHFFPFTQQHRKWILGMGKMKKNNKSWGRESSASFPCVREPPREWEWVTKKWKAWVHHGLGMHFQAFTCPTSQKHIFQKWVAYQIRIWPPCLSHPKEITSPTMEKHGKTAKSWRGKLSPLPAVWESPRESKWVRKWKAWVHNGLGMPSQAFTCPTSQKHTFQKWVTSQIRIWPL